MSSVEERLNAAGKALRETRRPFDVSAGLRRLAREAGYTASAGSASVRRERGNAPVDGDVPPGPRARHQLSVVARWILNQPQAADHLQRLAKEIGEEHPLSDLQQAPLEDLDVDGAQVFACMLYLAGHPESASFWWQLAAGAGHLAASYCLYLHHLELGELKEAGQWRTQLQDGDGPDDKFLLLLEQFARYVRRHCTTSPVLRPGLTKEVERLATRETDEVLVLPERELADRLQDCTHQH